jgi:glycosyltransferase involved in cell wall biosynthesis
MTNSQLRFTVVTPNFNMGRHLAETIESVLRNLRHGDEYFIIDGGSTDNSLDVIRRYESRITGWISEPDKGYADAIAKGFRRGGGELLAWINSSDLLLPGALDCARGFFSDQVTEFIFGDDYYIDEESFVFFRSHGGARNLRSMMLYGGWTPLQDACFWRRSLYERVGGINPDTRYAADFELFLKFSIHGRCAYKPVAFSTFRKHAGQVSIGGAPHYQEERQEVLARFRKRSLSALMLEMFYFLWVRMRSRIFQPFWNSRAYRNRSIHELSVDCPYSRT